jgi:phosphoserine phosphatase
VDTTILVRVSGVDRPGITAGIMDVLAGASVDVIDVEQVVVHGHLELGILIRVPEDRPTIKDLLFFGWENEIGIDFEVDVGNDDAPRSDTNVTVIDTEVTHDF